MDVHQSDALANACATPRAASFDARPLTSKQRHRLYVREQRRVVCDLARQRFWGLDAVAVAYAPEKAQRCWDDAFREVLRRDTCVYGCGRRGVTIEHIVARSKGGANSVENYAGACRHCQNAKADKPLLTYLLERVAVDPPSVVTR